MNLPVSPITNLDIRCAEAGRYLAHIEKVEKSALEKALQDALAVLEEQGVYAMFLYLKARHKEVACEFQKCLVELLQEAFNDKIQTGEDSLKAARKLANNLDDLLFARELLRNALSYARYHLKAKES